MQMFLHTIMHLQCISELPRDEKNMDVVTLLKKCVLKHTVEELCDVRKGRDPPLLLAKTPSARCALLSRRLPQDHQPLVPVSEV